MKILYKVLPIIFLFLLLLIYSCKTSSKSTKSNGAPTISEERDSALVKRYSELLQVQPQAIRKSLKLYKFVDVWLKTPYNIQSSEGSINDVVFAQKLYEDVYGRKLPPSYKELFQSPLVSKFYDHTYLAEGDLIFFQEKKFKNLTIDMVAIYLHNNKFICPSVHTGGVFITSFDDTYWKQTYKLSGRLK